VCRFSVLRCACFPTRCRLPSAASPVRANALSQWELPIGTRRAAIRSRSASGARRGIGLSSREMPTGNSSQADGLSARAHKVQVIEEAAQVDGSLADHGRDGRVAGDPVAQGLLVVTRHHEECVSLPTSRPRRPG
jgi:hypothetical protein